MATVAFTSKKKDGTPRRIRPVTNERAAARQARKIVEARLGRKLTRDELVHHRDDNRMNNSPANLRVVMGQKIHRKIHPGI